MRTQTLKPRQALQACSRRATLPQPRNKAQWSLASHNRTYLRSFQAWSPLVPRTLISHLKTCRATSAKHKPSRLVCLRSFLPFTRLSHHLLVNLKRRHLWANLWFIPRVSSRFCRLRETGKGMRHRCKLFAWEVLLKVILPATLRACQPLVSIPRGWHLLAYLRRAMCQVNP